MRIIDYRQMKTVILAAVFFISASMAAQAAEYVSAGRDGVNLRSGPDTSASILYELPQGYPLKVVERKGQWLKVSDFENDQGWIFEPIVSKDRYVIVIADQGNVRSGPSVNDSLIGSVVREVILKQVGSKGDWIQFEHPQLKGWIHRKLIWP
jgi:SH3-like domain-containing protein